MTDDASDAIRKAVAETINARIDRMIYGGICGETSNIETAATETTLDVGKMLAEWGKLLRQARRTQVTFVVTMGHLGPPLKHETPCDGERIELSYHQAAAIHREWPLKLSKVIAEDEAEFVPVSGVFHEYVPMHLPAPPYELPPDEGGDLSE